MYDSDPLITALTGRAVTPALIDAARSHLVMLRSLRAEVTDTVPQLVPTGYGGWRSTAADRYVDRLAELRVRLRAACDSLDVAESQLIERIRRLEGQLEAQTARIDEQRSAPASPVVASRLPPPPGTDDEQRADAWTTR